MAGSMRSVLFAAITVAFSVRATLGCQYGNDPRFPLLSSNSYSTKPSGCCIDTGKCPTSCATKADKTGGSGCYCADCKMKRNFDAVDTGTRTSGTCKCTTVGAPGSGEVAGTYYMKMPSIVKVLNGFPGTDCDPIQCLAGGSKANGRCSKSLQTNAPTSSGYWPDYVRQWSSSTDAAGNPNFQSITSVQACKSCSSGHASGPIPSGNPGCVFYPDPPAPSPPASSSGGTPSGGSPSSQSSSGGSPSSQSSSGGTTSSSGGTTSSSQLTRASVLVAATAAAKAHCSSVGGAWSGVASIEQCGSVSDFKLTGSMNSAQQQMSNCLCKTGMSGGAIFGIVLLIVIILAGGAVGALFYLKKGPFADKAGELYVQADS